MCFYPIAYLPLLPKAIKLAAQHRNKKASNILFLHHQSQHKPQVLADSSQTPIVSAHYAQSLHQGLAVVLCCHALSQVVRQYQACVEQRHTLLLCFFHDAYAPVEIATETIAKVVMEPACDIRTNIETLMTHQHAV